MAIDKKRMAKLASGLPSKSEKMRVLGKAGFSRQEIADFLGVRYQFVRNVLVEAARRGLAAESSTHGVREDEQEFSHAPVEDPGFAQEVTVEPDGAVRIPRKMMEAAGVEPGMPVLVRFGDDQIEIYTQAAGRRRMQAEIRKYVPHGHSLVDDLLRERRREAGREQGGA